MKTFSLVFSVLAAVPLLLGSVKAADAGPADVSDARLISAQTATGQSREILLGLHIRLEKGWKTYWRTPGDTGIPPHFDWSASNNVKSVDVEWPRPISFDTLGLKTWGYEGDVIFPLRVSLTRTGEALTARLKLFYGVCEEVCIPISKTVEIHLPSGQPTSSADAILIENARSLVPQAIEMSNDVKEISVVSPAENNLELTFEVAAPLTDPVLILEGEEGDIFKIQGVRLEKDNHRAVFDVNTDMVRKEVPLPGRLIMTTLLDKGLAVQGQITVK